MNIDPTDKPKFNQLIADFFYFTEKYGPEAVMSAMMKQMFEQKAEFLTSFSEEEKSLLYGEGVKVLNQASVAAANTIHDELFPFGHADQPLSIEG